ncbi:MAG TPA: TIGR03557 family F420-dependent LLM class oxidoreductase, partial [Thermoleophilaceae bacterium]
DHYHPWNSEQGQSAFVWTVLGALAEATSDLRVATAVTCPTVRIHPAVIAQAAATTAAMFEGRFLFGVGSGEALNEHILGDPWPPADIRLGMLEEAIELIRALWTGDTVTRVGRHYRVEQAKLWTRPEEPPPILVSGFGPKAVDLAARIGDGYCTTGPDEELISRFRSNGGGDKLVQAGMKVCYGPDEAEAVKTVTRIWPNESLPGELAQVLPTPPHFEQACSLVTEEMIAESVPCGPDLDRHAEAIKEYADAGVDELYVQQIGGGHDRFFEAYARDILPRFS